MSDARVLLGVLVELGLIVPANDQPAGGARRGRPGRGRRAEGIAHPGRDDGPLICRGMGVGGSFGGGEELGLFITAAIAVHNIPESLAISLVLVPRGTPVWTAAGGGIFTSLPQPVKALPPFLFVLVFDPFLPVGFGLAGGRGDDLDGVREAHPGRARRRIRPHRGGGRHARLRCPLRGVDLCPSRVRAGRGSAVLPRTACCDAKRPRTAVGRLSGHRF